MKCQACSSEVFSGNTAATIATTSVMPRQNVALAKTTLNVSVTCAGCGFPYEGTFTALIPLTLKPSPNAMDKGLYLHVRYCFLEGWKARLEGRRLTMSDREDISRAHGWNYANKSAETSSTGIPLIDGDKGYLEQYLKTEDACRHLRQLRAKQLLSLT